MCALRRIYAVILQTQFYDCSCLADMRPFYGNTEPRIATAPSSWSDKHISFAFVNENFVEFLYLACHKPVVLCIEVFRLNVNHIIYIVDYTLSQNAATMYYRAFFLYHAEVFLYFVFGIYNRADLQQIECCLSVIVFIHIYGKLYLYRASHFLLSYI